MRIRSNRLSSLPPYVFAEIDKRQKAAKAAGVDVINLGIGDPDKPTPKFIVDAMAKAIYDPANHPYAYGGGTKLFREAAARFMQKRFGMACDPQRHIVALLGSKEGLGHLPIAVTDPGDAVLVPDIHYPVYSNTSRFASVEPIFMPTTAANGWLPDFSAVPAEARRRARLCYTNYPNNPTGACVGLEFYEKLVEFCGANEIIAISDQAYSEIFFEERPGSIWQARGAKLDETAAIEFHTLSKTFNMTGWRIAFAVGHPEVIGALTSVKSSYDSGVFAAIQQTGAFALDHYDHPEIGALREMYRARRDALIPGLRAIGCEVQPPKAGFFCWAKCPKGYTSWDFAGKCLDQAGVVVIPGAGFSESAKDYFRIALTVEVNRLEEACRRLREVKW